MQSEYLPLKKEKRLITWMGVAAVTFTALVTGCISEFNVLEAFRVIPGVLNFIFTDFLPPAVKSVPELWPSLLDTIYMAIISTITGAVISLIFALLCADTTAPHPLLKVTVRALASVFRNIPELAWTIILVPAFGIGKTVGLMALLIGSVGSMTRFFTESIEEINQSGIEAVRAVGGSYWLVLKSGVIPQCIPALVAWTLYNLELNVRSSTVIGMVGGGGIGFYILFTIKLFRYDHAAMAILAIAVVVILIELLSKNIRERII